MRKEIIIGSIAIAYDIFKVVFGIFCFAMAINFIHLNQINYATLWLVFALLTK